MKIAILGTRGIPNNYGGCEANAEMLSPIFQALGHSVTVYCPDEHIYQEPQWNGVALRHIYCPEKRLSIWGTLLYDFLCLRDAYNSDFDIILELGYVPASLFFPLFRKRRPLLFTNMDGIEWKRSKWNAVLRRFTKFTEFLGAKYSDALIADNTAIQQHLMSSYNKDSFYISYGAKLIDQPSLPHLEAYGVSPDQYFMLIARLEPENNIEMIIKGYIESGSDKTLLVIGSTTTKYGKKLLEQFSKHEGIKFLEGIFDYEILSSLRWHCSCYFHGHSVGGTNPSLLEAMASRALIAIHENPFNAAVVGDDAFRFSSQQDVAKIINGDINSNRDKFIAANREKIESVFTWENAASKHIEAFANLIAKPSQRR